MTIGTGEKKKVVYVKVLEPSPIKNETFGKTWRICFRILHLLGEPG